MRNVNHLFGGIPIVFARDSISVVGADSGYVRSFIIESVQTSYPTDLFDGSAPLSVDQGTALKTIVEAVYDRDGYSQNVFFVDGRAGTGKTYLFHSLSSGLRDQGMNVLCVAGTDFTALLLDQGVNAQQGLIIPCGASQNLSSEFSQSQGQIDADLIIWDDVMENTTDQVEFVDKRLREIRRIGRPFGGIPVVFGGDLARSPANFGENTASVTPNAIRYSYVWQQLTVLKLSKSMRLQLDSAQESLFSEFLGLLARGAPAGLPLSIPVYQECDELCEFVFPYLLLGDRAQRRTVASRAIIVAGRSQAWNINRTVIHRFPGEIDDCNTFMLPKKMGPRWETERDFSDDAITLKVGMPVVLLKTIDQSRGLCNGTRLVLESIQKSSIGARIVGGAFDGQVCKVNRCRVSGYTAAQLPIRPCFAITYKEAQGQSFDVVGVMAAGLQTIHGALYAALSRATSVHRVAICNERGLY